MRLWLIGVVVFVASAAILVLEIVAGRILAPYVGVTLQSFTAIIGTVLAGIAFGAWAGGRIADRSDPTAALGPVLAAGGVLAVVSPSFVYLVGPHLVGSSSIQTILLAAIGFLAPAAVLAMVTPLAAKAVLTDLDSTGMVVGSLSALGTAGALFGTFVTGFVLIAAVPSRPITWTVGVVLVVLSVNVTVPASRKWVAFGGVVLAVSILGSAAIATTCEIESAYYCVRVEQDSDRPSGRTLVLDTSNHSYVDVEDPTYLGFRYTRLMASILDVEFHGEPVDALFIGGGGFTLPRYLQAVNGGASTVLELDPALIVVAEEQLGLVRGPWLRIEVGDARLTLRGEPSLTYDIVVGDAFSSLSVPWHLTTEEFLIEVRDKMAPDGIYIMNVIDRPEAKFVHAELQTLGQVFPHVAVSAPQDYLDLVRSGNFVLVASTQPFDTAALERALPEGEAILFDSDALDWSDGGQILTDEFAPTDQLFQR
ncbi:MAG: fused MFS/spermidine synthase [Actinomycetota bacterium]|nr:fused MFS/spermidine synthase [Actinomycetota bacterium]